MKRNAVGTAWRQKQVRIGPSSRGHDSLPFLCCSFRLSPPLARCWSSASLACAFLRLLHLSVTSISPLKANGLHPATACSGDQMCDSSKRTHGLSACPVLPACLPACLQSKRISTHCPCSRLVASSHLTQFGLLLLVFFSPHAEGVPSNASLRQVTHHVIMCDDGMRRMSTSCEDGHDESDAALHRRPISLQVGLRDLQRRLHRFLIRAQTEMEQQ